MVRPSQQSQPLKPLIAGCAIAALLAGPVLAQPQARTSDEASSSNFTGAITAPVRDLNLMRDQVPAVLTTARDAPYLEPQNASCVQLAEMIAPLDEALGPDPGAGAKSQVGAGRMVYGAMADVTRDVIPFRSVVRRITGAARGDQKVRETREAGHLRRAYLKGFASAKNCYGPPQPDAKVQVADAPPAALREQPPIAVAALDAPSTVPAPTPVSEAAAPADQQPQPRFVLPESWVTQINNTGGTGAY